MAFEEYDKYEQSELVQKWLRDNGVSIIVGIAIGLDDFRRANVARFRMQTQDGTASATSF